ncbi:MAG: FAD-dependent oxidoreductase [Burkholderiales bacterium]|nr:FAD-dependent oxidoreductase [Burkholderiales bacterium]
MSRSASKESIAVVGGGIIGLSVAMELLRNGKRVTVIERDMPMQACSAGNAGYLSEANIFPPASPDMLWQIPKLLLAKDGPLVIRPSYIGQMLPWGRRALSVLNLEAHSKVTDTLAAMTRLSFESISKLASQAGAAELLTRNGGLVAFKTIAGLEKKAAAIDTWNRYGFAVKRLSGHQMRELEPALVPEIIGGLLFERSGRCSNPQRLGLRYAEYLRNHGVEFVQDEVKALAWTPNGEVEVQGTRSEVCYSQAVVCGGFWSGVLMKRFFRTVPLVSERGYHLMLPSPGLTLSRPIVFGEPHFAATPMDEGLRLAGTAEFARWDSPPSWTRADMLLSLAQKYLRHVDGRQAKPWMGIRPSLPDGLPAIGTVPDAPGIHYAFGHAHNGLTLSGVTAQCVAALVHGTEPPVSVAPMALARFN